MAMRPPASVRRARTRGGSTSAHQMFKNHLNPDAGYEEENSIEDEYGVRPNKSTTSGEGFASHESELALNNYTICFQIILFVIQVMCD